MNEISQGRVGRREFLRGGLRGAGLAGLAVVSALLVQRGGQRSGQRCTHQGLCAGCSAYADCGLPPALSRKQATEGGGS